MKKLLVMVVFITSALSVFSFQIGLTVYDLINPSVNLQADLPYNTFVDVTGSMFIGYHYAVPVVETRGGFSFYNFRENHIFMNTKVSTGAVLDPNLNVFFSVYVDETFFVKINDKLSIGWQLGYGQRFMEISEWKASLALFPNFRSGIIFNF